MRPVRSRRALLLLVLVGLASVTLAEQQQQPIPPAVANPALKAIEDEVAKMRKAMEPLPPPVDCVISAFTMTSATAWAPAICPATGIQNREELWEATVVTPPANGGAACPPLQETRQTAQACTTPVTPLLTQSDLVYEGAFRVPLGQGGSATRPIKSFAWGGTALSYSGTNTLYMVGHDWDQLAAEFSIPTPGTGATSTLPRATLTQDFTDILQGKRISSIDGSTGNGVKIGGIVPSGKDLVVTGWTYYDNAPGKLSHWITGAVFKDLTPAAVRGAFQVGTGFFSIVPTAPVAELNARLAGFVSGYMSTIPQAYQAELGGTHLTGNGGGISIVTRTSAGPSATVFTASKVGSPPEAGIVMGYPNNSSNTASPLNHPTLGTWGQSGTNGLYNGTQYFRGMVFPDGTRSILFIGWGGSEFCYGAPTNDPKLHLQPVPNQPGQHYCYDPGGSGTGTHGYPYNSIIYAYDVADFIAAKKGAKKPWEVVPYTTWTLKLPNAGHMIQGAAWDPVTRRIFLSAYRADGDLPVIHSYKVGVQTRR